MLSLNFTINVIPSIRKRMIKPAMLLLSLFLVLSVMQFTEVMTEIPLSMATTLVRRKSPDDGSLFFI